MPRFECDGCGVCCRSYLIFASEDDAARAPRIAAEGRRLPDHLATVNWTFQLFPLPFHETCCFLDESARRTIYASRPDVCRAFAAGDTQRQDARSRAGLPPLEPIEADGAPRSVGPAFQPDELAPSGWKAGPTGSIASLDRPS